jgi:hypothetical protein
VSRTGGPVKFVPLKIPPPCAVPEGPVAVPEFGVPPATRTAPVLATRLLLSSARRSPPVPGYGGSFGPVRDHAASRQGSTGPVWCGPMFHRSGPVWCGPGRGGERANAFSRSPLVPRMVTGAAVGARDHMLIVASMVSRRCTQAISDLACGTGLHRIDRVARIHRDNRSRPSVSVAGAVPVTDER